MTPPKRTSGATSRIPVPPEVLVKIKRATPKGSTYSETLLRLLSASPIEVVEQARKEYMASMKALTDDLQAKVGKGQHGPLEEALGSMMSEQATVMAEHLRQVREEALQQVKTQAEAAAYEEKVRVQKAAYQEMFTNYEEMLGDFQRLQKIQGENGPQPPYPMPPATLPQTGSLDYITDSPFYAQTPFQPIPPPVRVKGPLEVDGDISVKGSQKKRKK